MNERQPRWIFIICAARSGSRYLRDLLAASPEFAVVPYDVNFVWRRGRESGLDDVMSGYLDEKMRRSISRRLIQLSGWMKSEQSRFILEKTVSNSLRVPYLASMFPDARFIHLVRDGRAVVESARRMWLQPPQPAYLLAKSLRLSWSDWRYAVWFAANQFRRLGLRQSVRPIWGPRYPGINDDVRRLDLVSVCARQWVESVSRASSAFDAMPSARVTTVRYESLASSQIAIADLCRFIGVTDPAPILNAHRSITVTSHQEHWRSRFSELDLQRVEAMAGPWLRRLGYPAGNHSDLRT